MTVSIAQIGTEMGPRGAAPFGSSSATTGRYPKMKFADVGYVGALGSLMTLLSTSADLDVIETGAHHERIPSQCDARHDRNRGVYKKSRLVLQTITLVSRARRLFRTRNRNHCVFGVRLKAGLAADRWEVRPWFRGARIKFRKVMIFRRKVRPRGGMRWRSEARIRCRQLLGSMQSRFVRVFRICPILAAFGLLCQMKP